jgi:signal transduction histidine kinase
MLERLDNASSEQRRFVSDASHELRSPVSSLRTALEVSIDAEPSPERRLLLNRLVDEVARLESLLDQLLVLARSDEHRPSTHASPVDFSGLVRDESHRFDDHGVSIRCNIAEDITLEGHADVLTRVVRNLVSNATRYATSEVVVELTSNAAEVRLVVTDDGPGIPPADHERVFGRFVRLDEHRARSAGGSGLGLAIARDAAAAHGGTIRVADHEHGASFVVTLPR